MDRTRIVRRTSFECYKELVRNKVLSTMRRDVYQWLYDNGPATRNEIAHAIHMIPNNCSTRLKEMADRGIVREVGEDKCKITGKNVLLYDVTDAMPSNNVNGKKEKPEFYYVPSCDDCLPLQDAEDDAEGGCWMDPKVEMAGEGQPKDCPLLKKDFIVRAEARKR